MEDTANVFPWSFILAILIPSLALVSKNYFNSKSNFINNIWMILDANLKA